MNRTGDTQGSPSRHQELDRRGEKKGAEKRERRKGQQLTGGGGRLGDRNAAQPNQSLTPTLIFTVGEDAGGGTSARNMSTSH